MPAVLTHKSIMLLAQQRVKKIKNVLKRKVDAAGADVTDLDVKLLAIAEATADAFASEPRPRTELPGPLFAEPVGEDNDSYPISQYAVLGSMGPDITAFSSMLNPGQGWAFDIVHKGTPSFDRELVNAQSCDFIMTFWNQVKDKIETEVVEAKRPEKFQRMQAFVIGHLCHIAADTITHPYVNDAEWEVEPNLHQKPHAEVEGEMDALVARTILRRESTRQGQDWDVWWPSESLPEQFFSAYAEALKQVYGADSHTSRRKGYHDFEEKLTSLDPPGMDASFVEDGYRLLRYGVVEMGYGYGWWSWFFWLGFLAFPILFLPILIAITPHGKKIFLKDKNLRNERTGMESFGMTMLMGQVPTLAYGIWMGCLSRHGIGVRYWLSMSGLFASIASLIGVFISTSDDKRYLGKATWVFNVVPLAINLVQAIVSIVEAFKGYEGKRHMGHMGLALVFTLPAAFLVIYLLFCLFYVFWPTTDNDKHPLESGAFWGLYALWFVVFVALWACYLPKFLRDIKIPEHPEGNIINPRFVRLFDDTTIHKDENLESENVPAEVYPSGRRKLAKLWWTGTGDMYVRSDRYQLQFSPNADGSDAQVVPAPVGPMKLSEYLDFLNKTVKQPGANTTGLLSGAALYFGIPDHNDPDYELPSGATFNEDADDTFIKLGTSADNTEYNLYHAPKPYHSVFHGKNGAVPPDRDLGGEDIERDSATEGYDYIHNPDDAQTTDTLMSLAGDFGAILSMAAVTHMKDVKDKDDQPVNKIYQVFRNWNLDRRRVNEWRTIVAGGALSEKGSDRDGYYDKMLGGHLGTGNALGLGPADHAAWKEPLHTNSAGVTTQTEFDEGERVARQLGWVKVMREWVDMRDHESNQDPLATSSWRAGNPDNRALSRAMAYLFELENPTKVTP